MHAIISEFKVLDLFSIMFIYIYGKMSDIVTSQ